jgi:hypothetical protein
MNEDQMAEFSELVERVFGEYPEDDGESPMYLVEAAGDKIEILALVANDRDLADNEAKNTLYDSLVDYTYGVSLVVAAIDRDTATVYFPKVSNPYEGFDWNYGTLLGDLL